MWISFLLPILFLSPIFGAVQIVNYNLEEIPIEMWMPQLGKQVSCKAYASKLWWLLAEFCNLAKKTENELLCLTETIDYILFLTDCTHIIIYYLMNQDPIYVKKKYSILFNSNSGNFVHLLCEELPPEFQQLHWICLQPYGANLPTRDDC